MDPPEPSHQLLKGQRPPRSVERQHLAVEDERRRGELASRRLDDVGQARGDVGETPRPDPDVFTVVMELDAGAVVLVLERGGPPVGGQDVLEVVGDLGEHGQERDARTRGGGSERRGSTLSRQRRDLGEVAEHQRRAASRLERSREGAGNRLEHEPVRHPRPHLARDDPLQRLPLVRRRPRHQATQQLVADPSRAGAARIGDGGERRRDVFEREGRPGGFGGVRQPADSEHARIGRRKSPAREERDRGADGVGRKRAEVLGEERELVEPRRARPEPPAEGREPPELDHPETHYRHS